MPIDFKIPWAIFWMVYLVFIKLLYSHWHFYVTGQIVIAVNGQRLNNNIPIWSHWLLCGNLSFYSFSFSVLHFRLFSHCVRWISVSFRSHLVLQNNSFAEKNCKISRQHTCADHQPRYPHLSNLLSRCGELCSNHF